MTRRLALGAVFLFVAGAALPAQTTAPATTTNAAPSPAPNPIPSALPAAQVISRAEATLAEYQVPATTEPDPVETEVRQAMREMRGELQLFTDTTAISLAQTSSLDNIRTLEKRGTYLASFPAAWMKAVTDRTTELGKKLDQIASDQKTWTDTRDSLQAAGAAPELTQRANDVLARLTAAKADLTARQAALLSLEGQVTDEANGVNDALNRLGAARNRAVSQLFEANAPPVWSWRAIPAANPNEKLNGARQWGTLTTYAETETGKFVIHGALLVLLVGLFYRLRGLARGLTREEPGIAPAARLFEMPVSAGVLLSIFAGSFLYYPIAPRLLFAILGAVALVPSVVLLRHLVERRLFPILYALVAFFFLEEIRSVTLLAPAAERLFLLAEMLGAIGFLAWLLLSLRRVPPAQRIRPLLRFAGWTAFGALAVGWMAAVLGYTLLANWICVSVQRSATLGLALYAGVRILQAVLFILLRLRPLSRLGMMQQHRTAILRRTQNILSWAAFIWWALLTLEMVPSTVTLSERLFGSSVTRTVGWLGHYRSDGTYLLNFGGKLIVAVLVVWAVFQLSRLVRFVLETEFYPRLRLGAGLPYAISTTLHYLLMVAAFIAATSLLGVDMTKFTLLVSALGVGVGFGLQNIINNFVSGLILLFERPVKIGDTIQTGTDTGTVERIGIRASVLRTPGGTEVIVPNGTLISNNVTNWTLFSRERIILIPLNVARTTDMDHVIALLTTAAAAHPQVLAQPAPRVFAQALGPNLGLELRAWTAPAADWTQVRSELVLSVSAALARENITLA